MVEMPKKAPKRALDAIRQIRGFKTWTDIEVYTAIYEALQHPSDPESEKIMPGSGEPPRQGKA